MASWIEATLIANRHNNLNRQVAIISSMHAGAFWKAVPGSFYIAGGTELRRRQMLLSRIVYMTVNRSMDEYELNPSVLITENEEIAKDLIALQNEHHLFSSLTVTGLSEDPSTYKNYQPLFGMNAMAMNSVLINAMRRSLGQHTEQTEQLLSALINIADLIAPKGKLSLQMIYWLLTMPMEQVLEKAHQLNAAESIINALRKNTAVWHELMDFVKLIYESMENQTSVDCPSHLNLVERLRNRQSESGSVGRGSMTVILANSINRTLLNEILCGELSQITSSQYTLYIHEMVFSDDDLLYKFLKNNIIAGKIVIGIITEDPSLLMRELGAKGLNGHCLLGRGSLSFEAMETLLKQEGEFDKCVVKPMPARPGRGRLLREYHNDYSKELRITPQDMNGFDAVLKDYNNRLMMVRNLRF